MSQSEIARLRQQIEAEYLAAKEGLSGLASGTSRHDFITARMERMQGCQVQLAQIVGAPAAAQIVADTLQPL
jgi:hypothetical protein